MFESDWIAGRNSMAQGFDPEVLLSGLQKGSPIEDDRDRLLGFRLNWPDASENLFSAWERAPTRPTLEAPELLRGAGLKCVAGYCNLYGHRLPVRPAEQ